MPRQYKRVPLLLFSFAQMETIGKRLERIGRPLSLLHTSLADELRALGAPVKPEWYAGASLLSAILYGVFTGLFFYAILNMVGKPDVPLAGALGLLMLVLAFVLHMFYPAVLEGKITDAENRELLFALREIIMGVKSGMTLYQAMKEIATSNYGYVSEDFTDVIGNIDSGMFEREALKQIALKSESDYLKRAVWQIINAMDAGASVADSLSSIVDGLEKLLYRKISAYSANLNFIMLIYMMVAAAIPSLGVTFLVLLSAFSGAGVDQGTILGLLAVSFIGQIVIIGFAQSSRPALFGG